MTLAILSALCAAPLFAAAQPPEGPGMERGAERFARLDADHNGSISADEMKAIQDRLAGLGGGQLPGGLPGLPGFPKKN